MIQTARIAAGVPSWPATRPGVLRMPIPSEAPTMTASPKPTPRMRRSPDRAPLVMSSFHDDQHDVDRLADVASRVARAARLELDIAGLPSIHDRLAVRGVLEFAARQVHG